MSENSSHKEEWKYKKSKQSAVHYKTLQLEVPMKQEYQFLKPKVYINVFD